jgi:hypothetical protein
VSSTDRRFIVILFGWKLHPIGSGEIITHFSHRCAFKLISFQCHALFFQKLRSLMVLRVFKAYMQALILSEHLKVKTFQKDLLFAFGEKLS